MDAPADPPMIRLEGVSRSYRDGERLVRALEDIDLSVPRGEAVALVGRSGSGKSTLLHLIGGLEGPTAGRITVDGRALHEMADGALTRFRLHRIGFVFQFFHLLPALTAMENLVFPAELAGWSRGRAKRRAGELAEALDLSHILRGYPDRLSGGEQQRVAIARALMLDPPLLLVDEPTGNLDAETGEAVFDLLFGSVREQGVTIVLATHSEEAARRADRRIVLHGGSIVDDDGTARRRNDGEVSAGRSGGR